DLQLGQPGEAQHRALSDLLHDLRLLAGIEADIFLAAAEHDAAFLRLAQISERQGPDPRRPLGHQDLAALRPYPPGEAGRRRELGVAETSGQHGLRRGDRLASEIETKIMRRNA